MWNTWIYLLKIPEWDSLLDEEYTDKHEQNTREFMRIQYITELYECPVSLTDVIYSTSVLSNINLYPVNRNHIGHGTNLSLLELLFDAEKKLHLWSLLLRNQSDARLRCSLNTFTPNALCVSMQVESTFFLNVQTFSREVW